MAEGNNTNQGVNLKLTPYNIRLREQITKFINRLKGILNTLFT